MSDLQNAPDHRVAMEVTGLSRTVSAINELATTPDTAPFVRADWQEIRDSYEQLGSLIRRIRPRLEAAE